MRVLFVVDTGWSPSDAEALSQQQFDTSVVALGREVPPRIREYEPDVLVLDVTLPHLNGVRVAEVLREEWPDLPIIIAADAIGSPLPPLTEFVAKPYSGETLVDFIFQAAAYKPRSS